MRREEREKIKDRQGGKEMTWNVSDVKCDRMLADLKIECKRLTSISQT